MMRLSSTRPTHGKSLFRPFPGKCGGKEQFRQHITRGDYCAMINGGREALIGSRKRRPAHNLEPVSPLLHLMGRFPQIDGRQRTKIRNESL